MCSRVSSCSLAVLLAGCFADHPCLSEVCDGLDNDCDGLVDEDFVTDGGAYVDVDHCGGCAVRCGDQLPTAASTECVVRGGEPICRVASCPNGQLLVGPGQCGFEAPVLCLPCEGDSDCEARSSGARCLPEPRGGGRCGRRCGSDQECPSGYHCAEVEQAGKQCRPLEGSCLCNEAASDLTLACDLVAADGRVCVGSQRCVPTGLSECTPALPEACNAQDDDCDGTVDEGFVDADGRYASAAHCGACGQACAAPGPHMRARCEPRGEGAACELGCEDGFVDADGLQATGCECALSPSPALVVGGDHDCDGVVDPTPTLVFVSPQGDDGNDGLDPDHPVATLPRALAQGAATGYPVAVSRGIYAGPLQVSAGVSVIGGYGPDFREHDAELYPVRIESPGGGLPALRCDHVSAETYLGDLTFVGSEGTANGQGSTTMFLDACGAAVTFDRVTVLAARGAPGLSGADSSERLATVGLLSLAELPGVSGGAGALGGTSCQVAGGAGGERSCGGRPVRGGAGGAGTCPLLACDNASSAPCGNAGCTDFTTGGVCDIAAALRIATPNPPAEAGSGTAPGGAGMQSYNAPTNHGVCNFCDDNTSLPRLGDDGEDGENGKNGVAGGLCGAQLALDPAGRATAGAGGDGAPGTDGSGGGGGTAGAGYAVIANTPGVCSSMAGGGGGGGGSGGCGAPGGGGGSGGGASLAVLLRLAAGGTGPTLRGLHVVTASGGDGGSGGGGMRGGAGGVGAPGGDSDFWCARSGGQGGNGGRGGSGGGGSGGCGGDSIGVYVTAGTPAASYLQALAATAAVELIGTGGRGGAAGFSPGHAGEEGGDGTTSAIVVAP